MNLPPLPPDPSPEEEERILERPDGFYWIAEDRLGEVGPFDSYEAALADRDAAAGEAGEAPEPGESLEEAEGEIGINAWLDNDTGEPAEGQSPPRFSGE